MRRTHNPHDLDGISGVSSRGGGLPLLLARAGWMSAEEATASYSIRRDGVTVRATAIAKGVPVMSVGPPSDDVPEGVANFWLRRSEWEDEDNEVDDPRPVTLDDNGAISGSYVGSFVDQRLVEIGDNLTALGSVPTREYAVVRYVPIYAEIEGANRIVGFGRVRLTNNAGNDFLTKLPSAVAALNASAQLHDPSVWSALSPTTLDQLLTQFRSFRDSSRSEPLLAPALVRSIR